MDLFDALAYEALTHTTISRGKYERIAERHDCPFTWKLPESGYAMSGYLEWPYFYTRLPTDEGYLYHRIRMPGAPS